MMQSDFMTLLVRRPRVALRRVADRKLRLAIREYILNRRTQAEAKSFENVMRHLLGRG